MNKAVNRQLIFERSGGLRPIHGPVIQGPNAVLALRPAGIKDHVINAQVLNSLRELIVRHCATLVHRVDTLGVIILSLPDADDVQIELAAGRALAHRINGSSSTIGFDEVSKLAAALESRLVELQRQGQNVDCRRLAEVASLYRKLESTAQATSPEDSRLYETDLNQLG